MLYVYVYIENKSHNNGEILCVYIDTYVYIYLTYTHTQDFSTVMRLGVITCAYTYIIYILYTHIVFLYSYYEIYFIPWLCIPCGTCILITLLFTKQDKVLSRFETPGSVFNRIAKYI